MENTLKNKINFFASYMGSEVEAYHVNGEIGTIILNPEILTSIGKYNPNDPDCITNIKLILAPVTDITDKQKTHIYETLDIKMDEYMGDFGICVYRHSIPHMVVLIPFLKNHGYCVEWDREKYEKYGWIKPL